MSRATKKALRYNVFVDTYPKTSSLTLESPISYVTRLLPVQKLALKKLQIHTVRDLLYHFPTRYSDIRELGRTDALEAGQGVTLYGKLSKVTLRRGWKSKIPLAEATFEDARGTIKVIWFNQAYIAKMYPEGTLVKLSGKISESPKGLLLSNPEIARIKDMPIDTHDSLFQKEDIKEPVAESEFLTPVYKETRGVSSLFLYHTIRKCITAHVLDSIIDPIPEALCTRYHLPTLRTALTYIHFPKTHDHVTASRKRFAFEEIFLVQVQKQKERMLLHTTPAYSISLSDMHDEKNKLDPLYVHAFSFLKKHGIVPTGAQARAIKAIVIDLEQPHPMSRLLEGDVGSGKTAVAAAAAYTIITTRPKFMNEKGAHVSQTFGTLQVAYMAPTEILATQHFESFCEFFRGSGIAIGLITGSGCLKFPSKGNPNTHTPISRTQLLKWVGNGEISIVIGTHALIQKTISFKHLGLVIVDEQHRFGIRQRQALAQKSNDFGKLPHLLSMTATPIPRTLALTIYGDLDLTIIDEMPPGRKKVTTRVTPSHERDAMYAFVEKELIAGRQAYVICPRIDEDDESTSQTKTQKSVITEAKKLQERIFPKYRIGVLHGKMRTTDKDAVMKRFKDAEIDVLVSTTVIEVGVNVANASTIIIEGADRFGLSQLHQLRGRVIRGIHQPYCFLCTESTQETTMERLNAMKETSNGFELAEKDLFLRGAGELSGGKQSGISDIGMEAIKNVKLVEAARIEAKAILVSDATLVSYPDMLLEIERRRSVHLE